MWYQPLFLFIFICMGFVDAAQNVSIDDTSPRIKYSPASAWGTGLCDPSVAGCLMGKFDFDAASNKTLHYAISTTATSSEPFFAELTFNGTDIFVFGIDTSSLDTPQTLYFFVDGVRRGHITTSGKESGPFFSDTNLPDGEHVIRVETAIDTAQQFITLDRFVYTGDGTSSTPTQSTLTTPISSSASEGPAMKSGKRISESVVGGIVAAVVIVLAIVALGFFLIRRRRSRRTGAFPGVVSDDKERPSPRGRTIVEPFPIPTATGRGRAHAEMDDSTTEKRSMSVISEESLLEKPSSMIKGSIILPSLDMPPPSLTSSSPTSENPGTDVHSQLQNLDKVPLEALMIHLATRGVSVPGDAVPPAY